MLTLDRTADQQTNLMIQIDLVLRSSTLAAWCLSNELIVNTSSVIFLSLLTPPKSLSTLSALRDSTWRDGCY